MKSNNPRETQTPQHLSETNDQNAQRAEIPRISLHASMESSHNAPDYEPSPRRVLYESFESAYSHIVESSRHSSFLAADEPRNGSPIEEVNPAAPPVVNPVAPPIVIRRRQNNRPAIPIENLDEADNEMSSLGAVDRRTPGGSDRRHRAIAPNVRPLPPPPQENNGPAVPRKLSQYEIVTEPWKMWRREQK
ncbi:unnamed protein product [Caenorhabditis bovis]|uniref:Uncharacterized protein n=1 Tax=Caenorhabditis bovis TaxID=2654633 RepID=A0A8S1FE00_9PELO|nr:unnamed protein product [Caenorhabditis bovis]